MLSAKRDVSAAKRFFKKMMRAEHRRLPFSISVDKNAAYPEAFSTSQAERVVPKGCKLRRVKYLNNVTSARPQIHQKEGASLAMLQALSHSGTYTGRHRIAQHDKRSSQKVSRE
jgi:transposase-like protein